jgi:hypothetical protein
MRMDDNLEFSPAFIIFAEVSLDTHRCSDEVGGTLRPYGNAPPMILSSSAGFAETCSRILL